MNKIFTFSLIVIFSFVLCLPVVVLADGCPYPGGCDGSDGGSFDNPIEADSFQDLVVDFAGGVYNIVVPAIAVLMLVISGFLFMISGGNPEKITRAKKFLIWTLVGIAIVIAGEALVYLIKDILGVT